MSYRADSKIKIYGLKGVRIMDRSFRAGIAAAFIITLFSGCTTVRQHNESLIDQWQPELQQPIDELEAHFKNLTKQQEMNYTTANIAFLYDAKLYIVFVKLLDCAPESERSRLIHEQDVWLKKRELRVKQVYEKYDGGSMGPLDAGQHFISMTKERIKELTKKMELMSGE